MIIKELLSSYPDIKRLDFYSRIFCGPFGSVIHQDDYRENGVPLLRISNITKQGTIDEGDLVFLSPEKAQILATSQVEPGDLIVSQRGTLGIPAVVPPSYPKWNISANLIAIRKSEGLISRYIQAYLSCRLGAKQLERSQSGQVQGKITTEDVACVRIPIIASQEILVALLDSARSLWDTKIKEAKALIESIDDLVLKELGLPKPTTDERAIFAVRLADIRGKRLDPPAYRPFFKKGTPIKTPTKPLYKVSFIDQNTVPKPPDDETLVPYVGLPECDDRRIREVVVRPYKEVKGRSVVLPGDILFARIEPSVFNKKYVLASDLKGHAYAYTSTEFYVVKADSSEVVQEYLYAMFFCSFVYAQVKGKTTGSSGRRRITPELFRHIQIPIPKHDVQKKIATELMLRHEEAERLQSEAKALWNRAFDDFEQKLLAGGNTP